MSVTDETKGLSDMTVLDVLTEHMKLMAELAVRPEQTKSALSANQSKRDIVVAMEQLELLLARLDKKNELSDQIFKMMDKDRSFFQLSYDSKILMLTFMQKFEEMDETMKSLIHSIDGKPGLRRKWERRFTGKIFSLFRFLYWMK